MPRMFKSLFQNKRIKQLNLFNIITYSLIKIEYFICCSTINKICKIKYSLLNINEPVKGNNKSIQGNTKFY